MLERAPNNTLLLSLRKDLKDNYNSDAANHTSTTDDDTTKGIPIKPTVRGCCLDITRFEESVRN